MVAQKRAIPHQEFPNMGLYVLCNFPNSSIINRKYPKMGEGRVSYSLGMAASMPP
jgi:hypothetical protein